MLAIYLSLVEPIQRPTRIKYSVLPLLCVRSSELYKFYFTALFEPFFLSEILNMCPLTEFRLINSLRKIEIIVSSFE